MPLLAPWLRSVQISNLHLAATIDCVVSVLLFLSGFFIPSSGSSSFSLVCLESTGLGASTCPISSSGRRLFFLSHLCFLVYSCDFSCVSSVTGVVTTFGSGFNYPYALTIDTVGDLLVADFGNNLVRKVSSSGQFAFTSPHLNTLTVTVKNLFSL